MSGERDDLLETLALHEDAIRSRVREQPVQTNEVLRCTGLLPAFLTLAGASGLPLELLELGPSAGLNLLLDRYRYRYAHGTWGDSNARVELVADERGGTVPAELLTTRLPIVRRRGIDLQPVDVTQAVGYRLLHSFIWPGRAARVERLDRAVEALRATPTADRPELRRGDYVELLPVVLAERPADRLTVVFQTASTGYLTADANRRLQAALDGAGADGRPLAWVSTRRRDEREGDQEDRYELELRLWPGEAELVAYLDFHGNWLDWIG